MAPSWIGRHCELLIVNNSGLQSFEEKQKNQKNAILDISAILKIKIIKQIKMHTL
jgi:hypothetical protein